MFTKKEIKKFVEKAANHWLFPDFTNKLTWFVASLGGVILATPTPLKEIVYNFLVDTINLNSGEHYSLAELQSGSVDPVVGLGLIVFALAHNLANKFLTCKSQEFASKDKQKLRQVDVELFNRFLVDFPSDGYSVPFLKDHDLGGSYHNNSLNDINKFVNEWDNVECHFLNGELEEKRAELWSKCHAFVYLLASRSYSLNSSSMFSCVPDAYRGAWDYPKHVDEQLSELNEKAAECYQLHQAFVLFARRELKC
ncbi:hypothetical protein [Vibrio sp. VB16]|uniref:hypothetical protein n=1 Tax=Vibrio sp. VB16 TaxID=2785746 RepID=UPI00189D4BFC|nr:hypothetical protein [Vibrio sp. VB16]UGA55423.1 hypothetical protein IUZ65_003450 [Vibrio sp. VB16]